MSVTVLTDPVTSSAACAVKRIASRLAGSLIPHWWEPLFHSSHTRSIFLSTAWMQTWLDVYHAGFRGLWVRWEHDGTTVGCLLLTRTTWRRAMPMRTLFFNATGETSSRTPLTEFNDVLHVFRLYKQRFWPAVAGYLYNFTSEAKVYFFSSGFDFQQGCQLSPGIVTHCFSIEHYRQRGMHEYDFLAGDMQYKRTLANASRDLYWTTLYRDRGWLRIAIWLYLKLVGLTKAGPSSLVLDWATPLRLIARWFR